MAHFFVRHTTGAKENGINQTKQNLSAWSNERNGMDSIRGPEQNQNHRRYMKTVIVKSFADDYDCDHLQSDEDINTLKAEQNEAKEVLGLTANSL